MFVKPNPPGVNRPLECDRMHIVKVISGDVWKLDVNLFNPTDGQPARPENTFVNFVLSENKFNKSPFYVGRWTRGVYPDSVIPGLVHIVIPEFISRILRRGTYAFSTTVTDIGCMNRKTELSGYFEVEYEPSSPLHDIPYRDDDGAGSQALDDYLKKLDAARIAELQRVIDEILTGDGSIHNMEEGLRVISEFLVEASVDPGECPDAGDPDNPPRDMGVAIMGVSVIMQKIAESLSKAIGRSGCAAHESS